MAGEAQPRSSLGQPQAAPQRGGEEGGGRAQGNGGKEIRVWRTRDVLIRIRRRFQFYLGFKLDGNFGNGI